MANLRKHDLGFYENKIISFIKDDIGVELGKIGKKNFEKVLPVELNKVELIDENVLKNAIAEITRFLKVKQVQYSDRPVWFRTNIIDQAINDYVGIGLLNINDEVTWLKFVIYLISLNRAEQGGDTLLTIFDQNFGWAINFELSQDLSCLTVQKFEKI